MALILRPSSSAGTLTTGSAYSSGNVVGGLITFNDAVFMPNGDGIIHAALLRDKSGNASAYELWMFDGVPKAQTDKTAVAFDAASLAKWIGTLQFAAPLLGAASTMGGSTLSGIGHAFRLLSGAKAISAYLVTRGTPTFNAAADVSVDLLIVPIRS